MLNKRIHGEFKSSGIMMLVGMFLLWATWVIVALAFHGIIYIPFRPNILINAVLIFLLILFIQQRKSFLLYQKRNQALPDEEGGCTTCMIVWCLVPCNHGQIGSATEKQSHTRHTVQTV